MRDLHRRGGSRRGGIPFFRRASAFRSTSWCVFGGSRFADFSVVTGGASKDTSSTGIAAFVEWCWIEGGGSRVAEMELDESFGDNGVEFIDATDPQDLIPNKGVSTPLLLTIVEDSVEVKRAFDEAFPDDRSTTFSDRLDAKSRRLPGDIMGDAGC